MLLTALNDIFIQYMTIASGIAARVRSEVMIFLTIKTFSFSDTKQVKWVSICLRKKGRSRRSWIKFWEKPCIQLKQRWISNFDLYFRFIFEPAIINDTLNMPITYTLLFLALILLFSNSITASGSYPHSYVSGEESAPGSKIIIIVPTKDGFTWPRYAPSLPSYQTPDGKQSSL